MIIPLFNEEKSVEGVLRAIRQATTAHVLAVDDGSTDSTSEVLRRWEGPFRGLSVIRHPENRGYGQSLIDGLDFAARNGYKSALTIDGDEQHEPQLIPVLLDKLREGWDIVSGSRYKAPLPGQGKVPPDRLRINRRITALINRMTGYDLTDAFCGFKAYRVEALESLFLTEPGYGLPLQLWIQASKHGLSVTEVAVPRVYKPNFERRFGGGLDNAASRLSYYLAVIRKEVGAPSRLRAAGRTAARPVVPKKALPGDARCACHRCTP
ncbi:MAG: glycosyltransferase family 2 protein [Firmicutes bacterium]|nr:glycosyltransferase family 2 protein [Bacillota bacterium]